MSGKIKVMLLSFLRLGGVGDSRVLFSSSGSGAYKYMKQ